jgi:hypothetical protein
VWVVDHVLGDRSTNPCASNLPVEQSKSVSAPHAASKLGGLDLNLTKDGKVLRGQHAGESRQRTIYAPQ